MLPFILSEFGKQNRAPLVVRRFRSDTDDKPLLGFLVEERPLQDKRCSFFTLRWHVLTKVLLFSCSTNWCLRTSPLLFGSQLKDWFLRILCSASFRTGNQLICWVSWLLIWSCLSVELDLWLNSTSFSLVYHWNWIFCTSCAQITAPQVAFLPTKSYVFSSELTASFILYYPACNIKAFVLEFSLGFTSFMP